MRVDFIGHATLLIRHGGLTLLSDPWWSGPAYRDQWYPYPIPVPERYDLSQVDAVYISHSHEDHLHAQTLRSLLAAAPNALALIPLRAESAMREYLRRIGFRRIRELASGTPLTLGSGRDGLRLTLLTHVDDSLLAVQAGGETLLNLNDALHSSRRELIVEYCRVLRGRLPSIDYLFCGFGGASYFPNCVHVPGKDDVSVARARERWFLQNFLLISELLKPRFAFPFAAHFVLPDERNWWISETRLRMEPPSQTLRSMAPQSAAEFVDLRPGDYVEGGTVHQAGGLMSSTDPAAARAEVVARYGPAPRRSLLDDSGFDALVAEMRARVTQHPAPPRLDALIVLTDYPPSVIRLLVSQGERRVEHVDAASASELNPQLRVETRSDLVRSTLRSPFGKDLISIGYGGQFSLRSTEDLSFAPHDRLLQVLAPTPPRWRQQLRARPLRTMRYLLGDPSMRLALRNRLRRSGPATRAASEPAPYELRDWVAVPES